MQEYCPASGRYDRKTVMHNMSIMGSLPTFLREEKGSACSQEMGLPQVEVGRTFSGRDSGTATRMKNTSKMATAVASVTTSDTDQRSIRYAPNAGDTTMLAANVADTWQIKQFFYLNDAPAMDHLILYLPGHRREIFRVPQ